MQINTKVSVLLAVVAEQTGVSVDEITGKSRRKSVMAAKWHARKLLKEKTELSGAEIMLYTGSTENNHRVTRTTDTKKS